MDLKKILRHPTKSISRFANRCFWKFLSFRIVPDRFAIRTAYKSKFKKFPDLDTPKTFNEKLNWMKLNYRKPLLTQLVDKYEVKEYVSSIIGKDYVIPSIAIFEKWEDIDFSEFKPPYVIKTTHSSGVIKVIRNESDLDLKRMKKTFKKSLRVNYFYKCREWPYKNCKPRIIIEEFIKDPIETNLPVFKFFCFNGEPFLVQTIKNDKTKNESIDYFDMDWKLLDIRQNFPNSEKPLEKPINFEEMKKLASKLSTGFPFVRVDLYSVGEKIYFSEFTFFSDAGYIPFVPEKWDLLLGEKINLN